MSELITLEEAKRRATEILLAAEKRRQGTGEPIETDWEAKAVAASSLMLEQLALARSTHRRLTTERDAATARLTRLEQRVEAICALLADKNIVDQDGQCVTCWTDVEDPISPEPHGPNCLIVRLRAAAQESDERSYEWRARAERAEQRVAALETAGSAMRQALLAYRFPAGSSAQEIEAQQIAAVRGYDSLFLLAAATQEEAGAGEPMADAAL